MFQQLRIGNFLVPHADIAVDDRRRPTPRLRNLSMRRCRPV